MNGISNTHAMLVNGPGPITVARTVIGQITLPAGGPWKIHNVFAQVVSSSPVVAQMVGGSYGLQTVSGDISPNPSPSTFPAYEQGSSLGAFTNSPVCPLNLFEVDWTAAGKSVIDLYAELDIAVTNVPEWLIGIIFGLSRPAVRPIRFCDHVQMTGLLAPATAVGTITLSQNATRITGVCAIGSFAGVRTTVEEMLGFVTLTSDDVQLPPLQLPMNNAFGAGVGAAINAPDIGAINFIPVDIPVKGGARINITRTLNIALTVAANCTVYIAYE